MQSSKKIFLNQNAAHALVSPPDGTHKECAVAQRTSSIIKPSRLILGGQSYGNITNTAGRWIVIGDDGCSAPYHSETTENRRRVFGHGDSIDYSPSNIRHGEFNVGALPRK